MWWLKHCETMSIYVLCNSETILSFMLCYLKWSQWPFIACQRSCGKAMFSVVCVCQSIWQRGLLMWPLPTIHWTSPHRDPPRHIQTSSTWTPHCTAPSLPPRHVQTSSTWTSLYLDPLAQLWTPVYNFPPPSSIPVQLPSGWFTTYCNVFFCFFFYYFQVIDHSRSHAKANNVAAIAAFKSASQRNILNNND